MKTTVAQIQRCKPGLGLPGNAEETLTVFTVVNQLQTLLLDLEKVRRSVPVVCLQFVQSVSNFSVFVVQTVPALFTQQPLSPAQSRAETVGQTGSRPPVPESSQLEAEVSSISGITEPGTVKTR